MKTIIIIALIIIVLFLFTHISVTVHKEFKSGETYYRNESSEGAFMPVNGKPYVLLEFNVSETTPMKEGFVFHKAYIEGTVNCTSATLEIVKNSTKIIYEKQFNGTLAFNVTLPSTGDYTVILKPQLPQPHMCSYNVKGVEEYISRK